MANTQAFVPLDGYGSLISLEMVEILYFLQGFSNCQLLGLVIGAPLRHFILQMECQVFVNKYFNFRAYARCAFAAVRLYLNHIIFLSHFSFISIASAGWDHFL